MKSTDLNYASGIIVNDIPTDKLIIMRNNISAQASKLYDEMKMIDAELRKRKVEESHGSQ